jgi:hypothetical protein
MKELSTFTKLVVANYQKELLAATQKELLATSKGSPRTKTVTVDGYLQTDATFIYKLHIENGFKVATDKGVYVIDENGWLDAIPHILPMSIVRIHYPEILL